MNIMDMTVKQILHGINLVDILIALSFVLNFEAIVRQVAVNKGYTNVVSWCDRLAAIVTFIVDVFSAAKIKKAVPIILLCIGLAFSMGCASAVMKSGCGHINGAEVTIPYVGGKANGNAYGCYMGCVGMNCKAPDYANLATVTSEYIKDASKDNAITTTSAGTIQFIPAAK